VAIVPDPAALIVNVALPLVTLILAVAVAARVDGVRKLVVPSYLTLAIVLGYPIEELWFAEELFALAYPAKVRYCPLEERLNLPSSALEFEPVVPAIYILLFKLREGAAVTGKVKVLAKTPAGEYSSKNT
jgi:hypothetical protein